MIEIQHEPHHELPADLCSDAFDTIVQVLVGPEKISFNMHKGLLCKVAPYFEAALKGNFLESTTQVLELAEEDPVMFQRFQLWTYTNKILEDGETDEDLLSMVWGNLWIFGEAHGIPELQNRAIDGLINSYLSENKIHVEIITHVYDNTLENSPLRRLFVDWTAFLGNMSRTKDSGWFTGPKRPNYPNDFWIDLVFVLHEQKTGVTPRRKDFNTTRSDYYVKTSDPPATPTTSEQT